MRLSEAIALGRTLVKPKRGTIDGCALGMANEAISGLGYTSVEREWLWISEQFELPCKCRPQCIGAEQIIMHLFDYHVIGYEDRAYCEDWTLDQLIDWVRSVEPEEAPSPTDAIAESCISPELVEKVGRENAGR